MPRAPPGLVSFIGALRIGLRRAVFQAVEMGSTPIRAIKLLIGGNNEGELR